MSLYKEWIAMDYQDGPDDIAHYRTRGSRNGISRTRGYKAIGELAKGPQQKLGPNGRSDINEAREQAIGDRGYKDPKSDFVNDIRRHLSVSEIRENKKPGNGSIRPAERNNQEKPSTWTSERDWRTKTPKSDGNDSISDRAYREEHRETKKPGHQAPEPERNRATSKPGDKSNTGSRPHSNSSEYRENKKPRKIPVREDDRLPTNTDKLPGSNKETTIRVPINTTRNNEKNARGATVYDKGSLNSNGYQYINDIIRNVNSAGRVRLVNPENGEEITVTSSQLQPVMDIITGNATARTLREFSEIDPSIINTLLNGIISNDTKQKNRRRIYFEDDPTQRRR